MINNARFILWSVQDWMIYVLGNYLQNTGARLYKPISVLGRYSKSWIINSGLEWPSGYARKHNFSHPLHAACEAPWKQSFLSYLPHGRCSLAVITSRRAAEASPRSLEVHWQEVSSCCANNQMFLELVNWYGMHTGRNCRGREGDREGL